MRQALEIAAEREGDRCWLFTITRVGSAQIESEMSLAWADYDWWSPDGRDTPAAVALAVATVFDQASAELGELLLPKRFDASTVRRRVSGADALITARLGQAR